MYFESITELLEQGIKRNGLIPIEDYIVKKHFPLDTIEKQHNCLYEIFHEFGGLFPLADFFSQEDYYPDDLFSFDGEQEVFNLFRLFGIKSNNIFELKSIYSFFKNLVDLVLSYNENRLYFVLFKEYEPLRIELKVKSKIDDVDSQYLDNLSQKINIFNPINNWFNYLLDSSFMKNNQYPYLVISNRHLLSECERSTILKKIREKK